MGPPRADLAGATRLARLRDSLGLERNVLVMTAAGILQALGIGLWAGYLPKVLEVLGARGLAIGAYGTAGALLGVVFPYLGGVLSDRLGRGRAMILASALAAAGYLFYMLAPTWWMFLPGLVLTAASGSFGFMGALALTGDAVRSGRRATSMAVRGVVGMLPGVLAPPLGGALIVWVGLVRGVRAGLLVTIVLTLAAVWFQRRYYRMPRPAGRKASWNVRSVWRAMRPDLRRLLAADCWRASAPGCPGSSWSCTR